MNRRYEETKREHKPEALYDVINWDVGAPIKRLGLNIRDRLVKILHTDIAKAGMFLGAAAAIGTAGWAGITYGDRLMAEGRYGRKAALELAREADVSSELMEAAQNSNSIVSKILYPPCLALAHATDLGLRVYEWANEQ